MLRVKTKEMYQNLCFEIAFHSIFLLRPVYTGDFCRGNSMQFLSQVATQSATKIASSCATKIACVYGPLY